MSNDAAKANRRAMEWDQRRRASERVVPQQVLPAPEPPRPGTIGWDLQQAAASRAHLDGVPDWSSPEHVRVENVWRGQEAACFERKGHTPSRAPHDQPDVEAEVLLSHAHDAGSVFIREAGKPGASAQFIEHHRAAFDAAVLRWLNHVTADWPDRKTYERQQANHRSTW